MTSKPISLLEFSNTSVRGGVEEHVLLLLRYLDRSLFRVHLACPPELVRLLAPDLPADVEVLPTKIQSWHDWRAIRGFARILRERQIQVLHSHMFFSSLFGSPVGRWCGVPAIIETPHVSERWRTGWLKSRYWVDRLAGRCVDRYIAVSEANARYLADEKRIPGSKIEVIRNGVDLARFAPRPDAAQRLRSELGFSSEDRLLVVLGRLEPQKGHSVLLDALPSVCAEFPRVHVLCLGDGRLRGALSNQAKTLNLGNSVHFVGYQKNVPEWLTMAEFTVLPSFYEGLPLVAIESLAAGRTMVATAVDGTSEVVRDGWTGLTVPPGDPDGLAHAICRLLRDPGLRDRLAAAGQRFVHGNFSHATQVARTEELYQCTLRSKGITVPGRAKEIDTEALSIR